QRKCWRQDDRTVWLLHGPSRGVGAADPPAAPHRGDPPELGTAPVMRLLPRVADRVAPGMRAGPEPGGHAVRRLPWPREHAGTGSRNPPTAVYAVGGVSVDRLARSRGLPARPPHAGDVVRMTVDGGSRTVAVRLTRYPVLTMMRRGATALLVLLALAAVSAVV